MPDPISCFVVAGGLNAVLNVATEPLDRVRHRFAFQNIDPKVLSGEVPRFGLPHRLMWHMLRTEGVRTVFPSFKRVAQRSAILMDGLRFGLKELFTTVLPQRYRRSEYARFCIYQYAAGGLAGFASHVVHYPIGEHGGVGGLFHSAKFLTFKNFKHSAHPAVVYNALYFGTFEALKAYRPHRRRWEPQQHLGPIAGQALAASFIAQLLSRPFINASAALRHMNDIDHTGLHQKYVTYPQALSRLRREQGTQRLFRGLSLGSVFTAAALLIGYEFTRDAAIQQIAPEFDIADDHGSAWQRLTLRYRTEQLEAGGVEPVGPLALEEQKRGYAWAMRQWRELITMYVEMPSNLWQVLVDVTTTKRGE
eukprot:TRINITY_DN6625_c0_g2_i1.p1 TRINITY_DN6625_c0_g2~~TRINITY_DN6625_c0_g2_i1.p1  ORF type:complete len:364 (+),score=101.33 TRINITY_DN6625_c0_g2_i1:88-1179(+)